MEEARTLRCAALVAESLQMELCPGVAEVAGSGYDAALAPEPRSPQLPQLKDEKQEPVAREPQRAKRGTRNKMVVGTCLPLDVSTSIKLCIIYILHTCDVYI